MKKIILEKEFKNLVRRLVLQERSIILSEQDRPGQDGDGFDFDNLPDFGEEASETGDTGDTGEADPSTGEDDGDEEEEETGEEAADEDGEPGWNADPKKVKEGSDDRGEYVTDGVYKIYKDGKVFKGEEEQDAEDFPVDKYYRSATGGEGEAEQSETDQEGEQEEPEPEPESWSWRQATGTLQDYIGRGGYLADGFKGPVVEELQKLLMDKIPGSLPRYGADGMYGAETKDAVARLQVALGFTKGKGLDGMYGPNTHRAWAERQFAGPQAQQPPVEPADEPPVEPPVEPADEPADEPPVEPANEPPVEPPVEPTVEEDPEITKKREEYQKALDSYTAAANALPGATSNEQTRFLRKRMRDADRDMRKLRKELDKLEKSINESIISESTYSRWQKLIKG